MFSHQHRQLSKAVLRTLAYADIFDYPLRLAELHRYLYKYSVSFRELSDNINEIPGIAICDGYITFADRQQVVRLRRQREKISRQKIKEAYAVAKILSKLPGVLCIAVSGSVGANNAKVEDDIDFFIITKHNQLWLTRLLVTLQLKWSNKKRAPHVGFAPNMVCTNLWVTPESWVFTKHTLFIAREIAQIKVLVNKSQTFEKFLDANRWIVNYFPNFKMPKFTPERQANRQNAVVSVIDWLLYLTQCMYMRKKRTTEAVSRNFAAFHPGDVSSKILQQYAQRVKKYVRREKSTASRTMKVTLIPIKQDIHHITPGS